MPKALGKNENIWILMMMGVNFKHGLRPATQENNP
jgi:hypothetical protein